MTVSIIVRACHLVSVWTRDTRIKTKESAITPVEPECRHL